MERALPVTAQTILTEATVAEDGSLHLTDPTLALTPGEKVLLAISPMAKGKGESKEPLRGTVICYDDPFGPSTSPEDWACRS